MLYLKFSTLLQVCPKEDIQVFCAQCVLNHSVVSDSLQPHGPLSTRLLWPQSSPGNNTGVGCHFLLQGIFSTQESNSCLLCLLYYKWILYPTLRLILLFLFKWTCPKYVSVTWSGAGRWTSNNGGPPQQPDQFRSCPITNTLSGKHSPVDNHTYLLESQLVTLNYNSDMSSETSVLMPVSLSESTKFNQEIW